jgi:hypothetical protein
VDVKNSWWKYLLYSWSQTVNRPMRLRVRIDSPHPFVCRKTRLNGTVLRMRLKKTKVPCHSRCDTIKIPPCSKDLSAEHRPKFCSSSPEILRHACGCGGPILTRILAGSFFRDGLHLKSQKSNISIRMTILSAAHQKLDIIQCKPFTAHNGT